MPRCTRKGCQKDFEESANEEGSCGYHPGGPVRRVVRGRGRLARLIRRGRGRHGTESAYAGERGRRVDQDEILIKTGIQSQGSPLSRSPSSTRANIRPKLSRTRNKSASATPSSSMQLALAGGAGPLTHLTSTANATTRPNKTTARSVPAFLNKLFT